MRVYLAAQFGRRSELVQYAAQLKQKGWSVTSRWLFEDTTTPTTVQLKDCAKDYRIRCARRDLQDINRSDVLIFFSESEMTPRGSRHVEFGYALAKQLDIVVIGPTENIFHEYARVFEKWEDFMEENGEIL